jgi:hypothetical protein
MTRTAQHVDRIRRHPHTSKKLRYDIHLSTLVECRNSIIPRVLCSLSLSSR